MIENTWVWDNFNFDATAFKKHLKSLPPGSAYNLFAAEEYEIKFNDGSRGWNVLNEIDFKERGINFNLVFGGADKEYYKSKYKKDLQISYWPTFFINRSAHYLKDYALPLRDYNYLFISMNNLPRTHRCYLMDSIKKHKLDTAAALTWYYTDTDYNWKYWTPEQLVLSDKMYINHHKSNQLDDGLVPSIHSVPLEFFQSYFSVVSESSVGHCFLTEKTAVPLLLQQPFIVQAACGFHQFLISLGFELYDEIFDYSFDTLECANARTDKIIENILNLKFKDISKVNDQLTKKAKRNQKRALDIAADKSLVPELVLTHEYSKNIYKNELECIKLN